MLVLAEAQERIREVVNDLDTEDRLQALGVALGMECATAYNSTGKVNVVVTVDGQVVVNFTGTFHQLH